MNVQSILATAALSACLAAPAGATVVEGTMTWENSFQQGYMGQMVDIKVLSGTDTLPSTAFAFCIDHSAQFPGFDTPRQYTLTDSFAPFMSSPAAENKVTALLHYAIDYYYGPMIQGIYGPDVGYGFNLAMWQLTRSDGTKDSVAAAPNTWPERPLGAYDLYKDIMDGLSENYDDIAPDYRSARYDIRYLKKPDGEGYQSMAIVTEKAANEVPEPSTLALFLAAGGIGFTARARRKTKA